MFGNDFYFQILNDQSKYNCWFLFHNLYRCIHRLIKKWAPLQFRGLPSLPFCSYIWQHFLSFQWETDSPLFRHYMRDLKFQCKAVAYQNNPISEDNVTSNTTCYYCQLKSRRIWETASKYLALYEIACCLFVLLFTVLISALVAQTLFFML